MWVWVLWRHCYSRSLRLDHKLTSVSERWTQVFAKDPVWHELQNDYLVLPQGLLRGLKWVHWFDDFRCVQWLLYRSPSSRCSDPQKVAKAAAVDRLTDSTKYTGSHKERFDESGKGKGKAGREERPDTSGYVAAYKGQGSYDDKVKEAEADGN